MKDLWERFKIFALILLLVFTLFIIYKLDKFESQIRDFTYRISNLEDLTNNISGDISESITSVLEKENSIISDFKYSFNSLKAGKMSLDLKVLPKEYSLENTYYFSYLLKDGSSKAIKADLNDGNYLVANIDFPLEDKISINYVEESKTGKRLETLTSDYLENPISTIQEQLLEPFNIENGPFNMSFESVTDDYELIDETYEISYSFDSALLTNDKGIESAEIHMYLDGKMIDSFPMEKDKEKSNSYRQAYKYTFKDYKLDFKDKDTINIYAIVKHTQGFKVKILVGNIYKEKDGENIDFGEPWEDIKTLVY